MQKNQSDLGLIFRKRARRRLVGAIALVLLMVILLPRVLEDRAQTNTQQDIAIVMPDGSSASDVAVKKTEFTSKNNPFYVQIGVFSDMANVKKLQVKLDELGYQSVAEKMKTATGEKTRLRTSTFEAESEAEIALKNIKDAGLTGMIVSQK
jgi:DedD protein